MRISIYINSFFCRLQKTFFVIPVRVFALKLTKKLNKPALAPLQNRKVWRNRPSHLLDTNENWKQVVELNMLKIRAITNDFALWFDFQVRFSFYLSNSTHFQLVVNIFQKNDNSAGIPSHDWIPLPQVSP